MTGSGQSSSYTKCPCGAHLYSKAELEQSDDEVLHHVAEAYLDDHSGFCIDEDEVVPYKFIDDIHQGLADANEGEPF